MARKKSGKKGIWAIIWLLITGGGLGGYLMPDLPVLGPLFDNVRKTVAEKATEHGFGNRSGQPISDLRTTFSGSVPSQLTQSQRPSDKILIASFNIQVFGQSKIQKQNEMAVIVNTIRQFDIVAIQEVRAKDDNILPTLVQMLNANGSRYSYIIGPRLGRSVSTEQYAFVFDTNRIEHDPASVGTMSDPNDLLHREPMCTRFRARTSSPQNAFTFWLVNIHTDPDEVKQEIDVLASVFTAMQSAIPDEDDVILLGDLNASEKQMGKFNQIPGIHWVVNGGVMTNTRQNKAYDNLVFHYPSTSEYTGRWGVFNFETLFQLTREQALKVSDHFPVWAEFHIWEAPRNGQFAERQPVTTAGGNRR